MGRRLPVDSKIVRSISRSPSMMAEQGSMFMQEWGGPEQYVQFSKGPPEARMVYFAVQEGVTDPSQLEIVTGLSEGEISNGLRWLEGKGLVQVEETPVPVEVLE